MNYSMKKQLDTNAVMNELKAGSAFFKQPEPAVENEAAAPSPSEQMPQSPLPPELERNKAVVSEEQPSTQEEILTNKQVSNQASQQESLQPSNEVTVAAKILAALAINPIKPNTFRYSLEELDFVRDIVYEAEVKHQIKLDKNDVVRIALEWLMNDYQEKGEASLLVSILTSKKARK